MSEDLENGDLIRVKAGPEGGELAVSSKMPGVLGRMFPVGWIGKREVNRAIYQRFVEKIRNNEEFTEAEAELAREVLDDPAAKFIRRRQIEARASVIVAERLDAGSTRAPSQLPANASPSGIGAPDQHPTSTSDDWVNRFRDDAGLVDDEMMRELYAQILAEEAMTPGSMSMRTLGVLRYLDRRTAENFLRAVKVMLGNDVIPQQGNKGGSALEAAGLDHVAMLDLDDAGLVNSGASSERTWGPGVEHIVRLPGQRKVVRVLRADRTEFALKIPAHLLTPAGRQLARLLDVDPCHEEAEALLRMIQACANGTTLLVAELPSAWWEGPVSESSWTEWRGD